VLDLLVEVRYWVDTAGAGIDGVICRVNVVVWCVGGSDTAWLCGYLYVSAG